MSISHELSSDIATALFTAKERSPQELSDLKDMLFRIHSTLEELSDSARKERQRAQAATGRVSPES